MTDQRYRTADGVAIVEGLKVWDYDRKLAFVKLAGTRAEPSDEHHDWWDGWFEMRTPSGGRAGIMNGERMCVRDPFSGKSADESWPALVIGCGYCEAEATHAVRDSSVDFVCLPCAKSQTDGPLGEYVRPINSTDRAEWAQEMGVPL